MDSYEVLVVEDGMYYIRYYPQGIEFKGIDIKLSEWDFYNFIENKREI